MLYLAWTIDYTLNAAMSYCVSYPPKVVRSSVTVTPGSFDIIHVTTPHFINGKMNAPICFTLKGEGMQYCMYKVTSLMNTLRY